MIKTRFTLILSGCLLLTNASLVMARQSCNTNIPPSTPSQRFSNHSDGTITDTHTGLMWKICLEGQRGADCSSGHAERMQWQQAVNTTQLANQRGFANHSDWHLPSLAELKSIVEQHCNSPAINLEIFPHMLTASVWSGNQSDPNAWSLDFTKGKTFNNLKGAGNYVRLVRNSR